MGMVNSLIENIETKILIDTINKQDPNILAKESSEVICKILEEQLGNNNSKNVRLALVSWIEKFIKSFNKELLKELLKEPK